MPIATSAASRQPRPQRSITAMIVVLLVSLAPIVAAVVMYYNPQWWPSDSSNYGQLIDPQRPMPTQAALPATTMDGKPFDIQSLKGKWLLVAADGGACPDSCARKLFITRNSHASQGKNVERLARVWFITDDAPVPEKVQVAYEGTLMLRVKPADLARFLSSTPANDAAAALAEPIWVIDPLGNLMLQFPADADPVRVRQDISKLVYNSRIG